MTLNTALPLNNEAVDALSRRLGEPAWLGEQRIAAMELVDKLPLPELTKTRLARWNLSAHGDYTEAAEAGAALTESLVSAGFPVEEQGENMLVQRNAAVVHASLTAELAAQGVIFTDLQTAAREHGELVQRYLGKALPADEHQLAAVHAALWSGGVFLYVPRNVAVEVPLTAVFLAETDGAALSPHVLVVAEEGSSLSFVESYLSAGQTADLVVHGAVEVFAGSGASVQYASVHSFGENVTDIAYRRAILEKDSRVEWVLGEMNAGNGLSDTTNRLMGNGSSADIKVICVGDQEQRLNLTARNVHFGRSTESDMSTRAVIRDSATAIINGITKIEKGATGANGQQSEKVLMLSPTARGDANPILLIDEDDVMAGHAASVGQVNPEQIYYLMSRGLTKAEAERLVIYGFLAPVVAKVPLPKLAEQLRKLVERKLGQ